MRPSTRRQPTTKPSVAQIYRPKETPRPQASQQTRSRQNPWPQALSHHQALPQVPRQRQQPFHVAHYSYNEHDGPHEGTRTPRRQSQRQQATLLANTHATAHRPAARSSPQTKPPAQQRMPSASSRYSPRTSFTRFRNPYIHTMLGAWRLLLATQKKATARHRHQFSRRNDQMLRPARRKAMRPPSTMRKSKAETPPPTLALSQSPCLFSAWTPITRNPYRKGRRLCGTDPCASLLP